MGTSAGGRSSAAGVVVGKMGTAVVTPAELLEQAAELRIPSGPVGNGATVTGFDHFEAVGTFVENPSGRFVQPRVPYRISGLEARPVPLSPALDADADAYALDWDVTLTAPHDAVLDRTPYNGTWGGYSGLALRGREDWHDTRLVLDDGAGRGRAAPQRSRWCDLSGTADGRPVGVCVLGGAIAPKAARALVGRPVGEGESAIGGGCPQQTRDRPVAGEVVGSRQLE